MHLRSITLRGFKSFPERTRLEFSPGVSVIVGPNGSGKSNITDAVLWALGEQSPLAVRGGTMQDVIFAGAHGVQARSEAEVEVVIDNGSGEIPVPMSEIAISRRLDRAGEGEYRINGARCRLGDVVELLSDTGLGKEMHSVVSQGRVEAIVTSKPKDRRHLIEEAAGLGKHRKRRRRAQLKLDRTQDNLDRALDVEREARARLKPLKRQAEAAELHERLERQVLEARWTLAGDAARSAREDLAAAEAAAKAAHEAASAVEAELADVARRREAAEESLTSRGSERETVSQRFYSARSAADRIDTRGEAAAAVVGSLERRIDGREALVLALEAERADEETDAEAEARIAALEEELEQLATDRAARIERELAEIEERRAVAALRAADLAVVAEQRAAERKAADAACEAARAARREAEAAADRARRESARVGAELAAVNHFLRLHAGAPGGVPSLADGLRAEPGYELALAAVLGGRLRAAVAPDLPSAEALLAKAGSDGGAVLVAGPAGVPDENHNYCGLRQEPLLARVSAADEATAALAAWLLDAVVVVEDFAGLDGDFAGVAVTRDGRVWDASACELRHVPAGGEDRVLAERNRRDALIAESEAAAQAEQAARAALDQAIAAVTASDRARDEADRAAREAGRAHQDAVEAERREQRLAEERRRAPDDEETAARRAQVGSALTSERRHLERAAREREQRARRLEHESRLLAADRDLLPVARRLGEALKAACEAVAAHVAVLEAELEAEREAAERLAADLRACAAKETQVQARLKLRGEEVTRAEVRAQQVRDRAAEAEAELGTLAGTLGLEPEAAAEPLPEEERASLHGRLERLARRREQLGPVNPLAQDEYAEAVAHVEDLEHQRNDLETAIRELQGVIRDADEQIRRAFEETFTAAARNFEEVVGHLFPGGRGRLRLVREEAGPAKVVGGESVEDELEAAADAEENEEPELGVEIEITPAGKATKRLSLLSGGEKSMTALAFLFAVFLARPCPFYVLDEVEAALDDLNIDRFLSLVRQYSDRAQFIVVTHQKRTMEAADCLYGVSMAGNGVSKVVSRRLPRETAEAAA